MVASQPLPDIFVDSARLAAGASLPESMNSTCNDPPKAAVPSDENGSTAERHHLPDATDQRVRRGKKARARARKMKKKQQAQDETAQVSKAELAVSSAPTPNVAAVMTESNVEEAALRVAASQSGVSVRQIRKLMQRRGLTVQSIMQQFMQQR